MATPRVPESALYFELFKAKSLWYFRLKSRNGKIVAQSEGYKQRFAALKTIDKIKQSSFLAEVKSAK